MMQWLLGLLVVTGGLAYFAATVRVYFNDRDRNPFLLLLPFWFFFYPEYYQSDRREFLISLIGAVVAVGAVIGSYSLSG